MDQTITTTIPKNLLQFSLCTGNYVLSVDCVSVILKRNDVKLSKLPDLPTYVKGVIDHGTQCIPIIDAGLRLENEEVTLHDQNCIILISVDEGLQYGLLVDSVGNILKFEDHDYRESSDVSSVLSSDGVISGMVSVQTGEEDSLALVLDFKQLAADLELRKSQVQQ